VLTNVPDEWGARLKAGMKFGMEVPGKAVRAEVGPDFVCGHAYPQGDEFHPDGLGHEEMKKIGSIL